MKTKFKKGDLILSVLAKQGLSRRWLIWDCNGNQWSKKNGTVFVRWQDDEGSLSTLCRWS